MLAALADIRRMGIQSALDAGLGPSVMPQDEIDNHAKHLFRHFRIVDPDVRGGAVDFSDAVLVPITDEMPTAVDGDDSARKAEAAPHRTRRGTRKAFSVGEDE
ncbi:hypothetical protein NS226_01510 [Aureimonas ureilytica]|uniref:Uncharacterized protein n=1 Tax=Aureimonas ureilytica TaxID=401562 RepID=A0A175RF31_9HYPH|nr:hypothetical protein [Aureimonas ureilytica]KTQ98247.1 hypothetical protein NS226_01510 [Aureimonas ureilytica]